MRRFVSLALLLPLLSVVTGCHCVPATERYNDYVDHLADNSACIEQRPPLFDVTRWGRSDGPCRCSNKSCCH